MSCDRLCISEQKSSDRLDAPAVGQWEVRFNAMMMATSGNRLVKHLHLPALAVLLSYLFIDKLAVRALYFQIFERFRIYF